MKVRDNVTGQIAEIPEGLTVQEATQWAEEVFGGRGWNRETYEHLGYLISSAPEEKIEEFAPELGWEIVQ